MTQRSRWDECPSETPSVHSRPLHDELNKTTENVERKRKQNVKEETAKVRSVFILMDNYISTINIIISEILKLAAQMFSKNLTFGLSAYR